VGVHLLDLSTRSFFLLNSSLALLWLLIGWSVVREHGRLVAGGSDAERA
jgi:hypothetical protein